MKRERLISGTSFFLSRNRRQEFKQKQKIYFLFRYLFLTHIERD
jgi:hypothetical protein